MTIHLYNPQNDDALGHGAWCYTPPARVVALQRAWAALPRLWAAPGDLIVGVDSPRQVAAACRRPDVRFEPWGWSADAVRQLVKGGVPRALLPGAERLEAVRRLSHRRTALLLRQRLGLDPADDARLCTSADEALQAVARWGGQAFAKRPWSCSGRGVFDLRCITPRGVETTLRGVVRQQGAVVVERARGPKRLDFAALYRSESGRVEHVGWSVFGSSDTGVYRGNLALPQAELLALITRHVDAGVLLETACRLRDMLEPLMAGVYEGPLGVDMMAYGDEGAFMPCVEVNLRRTMGFVAMAAVERGVQMPDVSELP